MIGRSLSHYKILEKLGSGGMGEVYRAKDLELQRDVAIKVLREELAANPERLRRFEQEARSASALNHPNIITIYEIGKVDSTPYIAMELVEGKTLREMLSGGPFPAKKMLPVATQTAEGLAKAHSAGIVHRDLKPENIMITDDGFVKILDFGLAKLFTPPSDADSEMATIEKGGTTPGVVMGTAGYMSPEQARGQAVDFRADQFAFGAILYEMVTGKRAFRRDSAVETLTAIIKEEPVSVTELNPSVPAHLKTIVERCLGKAADDRYDSTRDLARDLESIEEPQKVSADAPPRRWPHRLAIAGALTAVLAVAVGLNVDGLREWLLGGETTKIESIAVLPLDNLSGDPEQEYFADGMTEALTAELGKVGALRVISRTSVMMYKEVNKPLSEIARELNVDAVVEGSVLRSGDRVRITTQLVQAVPERHLWAESYERDLRDILSLQSEVARAVAEEIQITLTPQEESLLSGGRPVNTEAHEAYLLGRHYFNKLSPEGNRKAFELLQRSIELDPNFARAYSLLAYYFSRNAYFGLTPPEDALPKAKEAALKSIELDETLAEAHFSLGFVHMSLDWDWLAAEKEYKRAIELNPNSAAAHSQYGIYLSNVGRLLEGMEEIELALKLDPLSFDLNFLVARNLYFLRRYDESIERNKRALELKPNIFHQMYLVRAYWKKGMYEEAWEVFTEWDLGILGIGEDEVSAWKGIYEEQGYRRANLRVAQDLDGHWPSAVVAYFYIYADEKEKALQKLEQAFEERDPNLVYIKVMPEWDALRGDPRFQDVIRRINFPE